MVKMEYELLDKILYFYYTIKDKKSRFIHFMTYLIISSLLSG